MTEERLRKGKIHLITSFFFFVVFFFSCRDLLIYSYLEIPENCKHFIFKDGFYFVNILFVSMVKFLSFARLQTDHLSYPVMSSLVFLLCYLAAFTLLCNFTFHICPQITYTNYSVAYYEFLLRYNLVLLELFYAAINKYSISFLSFSLLSHSPVILCVISLGLSLQVSIPLFFPFLLSRCFTLCLYFF